MRIKKFKSVFEKHIDPRYEEEEEEYVPNKKDDDPARKLIMGEEEEEEEDEKKWTEEDEANFEGKEDMEHLTYLMRTMLSNSGLIADDFWISTEGWNASIVVTLSKKENLGKIVKILEIVKEIKKDLLPHYDLSFEKWETEKEDPVFVFNFEEKKSDVSASEINDPLYPEEHHLGKGFKKSKKRSSGGNNTGYNQGGVGRYPYDDDDEYLYRH
jgi:hypothetical protein